MRYEPAIAGYRDAFSRLRETPRRLCYLGYTYAQSGQHDKARAALHKLNTTKEYVSAADVASLYAALGETEIAFELLERAYQVRDPHLTYLKVDPRFDALRRDPRFQQLITRIGLPQ